MNEETLGKLAEAIKDCVVNHIHLSPSPLRTALCELLRPYFDVETITQPAPPLQSTIFNEIKLLATAGLYTKDPVDAELFKQIHARICTFVD